MKTKLNVQKVFIQEFTKQVAIKFSVTEKVQKDFVLRLFYNCLYVLFLFKENKAGNYGYLQVWFMQERGLGTIS